VTAGELARYSVTLAMSLSRLKRGYNTKVKEAIQIGEASFGKAGKGVPGHVMVKDAGGKKGLGLFVDRPEGYKKGDPIMLALGTMVPKASQKSFRLQKYRFDKY